MLVKDIIKVGAEYLDIKDVIDYVENKIELNDEIEQEINTFLLAINMVNSGIASSYLELVMSKELLPDSNNKISYDKIDSRGVIDVRKVQDKSGAKLDFKVMPGGVILDENCLCEIEYSCFPAPVNFDDEINYYTKINKYIFAMGVVAEYLYLKGNIDDAYSWDKRFKNYMLNLKRPRRNIIMPSRRW